MDYAAIVVLEILYMIAFLALISAGLAIVFGMMRVINLAHGEFVMLGGYATIASAKAGINIYFAMLVISPIVVGVIGLIVERLIVRFLYGRAKLACGPAAAVGVAALLAGKVAVEPSDTVAVVVSGGNVAAEIASAILGSSEGRNPS